MFESFPYILTPTTFDEPLPFSPMFWSPTIFVDPLPFSPKCWPLYHLKEILPPLPFLDDFVASHFYLAPTTLVVPYLFLYFFPYTTFVDPLTIFVDPLPFPKTLTFS